MLDNFLFIRGVKFLGTRLIFAIRLSNFVFFAYGYLTNHKQQQPTSKNSPTSQWPSIYRLSENFPGFQSSDNGRNYLQLAKVCLYESMRQIVIMSCEAAP